MKELIHLLPDGAVKMALVLLLSFFIGLEREQHKQHDTQYAFGGIRTFPLIGLVSYSLALISGAQVLPWVIGFCVIGGLMMLSYYHKLATAESPGVTTEITGLTTYIVGILVYREQYWLAATVAVLSVLLLELKLSLERLSKHVAQNEILTLTKFLVLSVVVLPIIPNQDFTAFHFNPFKTWLVIVAVSGISYGSYVCQVVTKNRDGVFLSALLGGAYSSTVTTIALARRAKEESRPNLFSGSILAASGVMYARLALLLGIFNRGLAAALSVWFLVFSVVGVACGWALTRRGDGTGTKAVHRRQPKNPLELKAALLFGLVFIAVTILTDLARRRLGHAGLDALAAVMGITDVDPFILGLTQSAATTMPVTMAAAAIVIAAASNNVAKAAYAFSFAERPTGIRSMALLLALAALGLLPLGWL